jgi:hypothetical protein
MEAARILGIKVGDKVLWRLEDKRIVVEKA